MPLTAPLQGEDFVGRREELSFLHEQYRAAREGNVHFVIVEGEAGIGKSRMIGEFLAAAQPQPAIASGSCSEQVRSPYLPFTQLLEDLHVSGSMAPKVEPKAAFFTAAADLLRRRAGRMPLIVALEDLQWADGATLELLSFLVQRLDGIAALFLLTMRGDTVANAPALAAFRGVASRKRAAFLQLLPLRRNDVRCLVQQTLQRRALRLPSETISQIEVLAEGNPLFAEELASLAIENGELTLQAHVPLSVAAILGERLAPFNEEERSTLVRAAIIGQSFDVTMLAGIIGASVSSLLGLMQRFVDHGIVVEDRDAPLRFRFRHALIRKALADRLVLALAAPLHVRIAETLEGLEIGGSRTAELAYHWAAARVADKARLWNERAAREAWNMYAYRDAIRFYNEALRWNYPDGRDRARICEHLGSLHYIDGCGEEPARWYSRSREEFEAVGDEEGAARATGMLADQCWVDARTGDALSAAVDASLRARRLGARTMEASALLAMARFASTLGDLPSAQMHLRHVAALDPFLDDAMRACVHEVRAETLAVTGNSKSASCEMQAASDLAARTADAELIAQIENNYALGAFDLGELGVSVERHQRALEEAERTGMMWRVAYCSLNYARTLTLRGELPAARTLVWSAIETGVTTATFVTKAAAVGIPLGLMLNDRALIDACALEEALTFAERSGEIQRIASVSAAFAELRAEQGAMEEARTLLGKAIERITHAHRAWDLFLAIASRGREHDVDRARVMLASASGRPRVRRTYALLFDAIVSAESAPERSRRLAATAASHFWAIGDELHRAQSLEFTGDLQAALDRYAAMGSVRDLERLRKPAAPSHPPRLTPRQRQIAHLVALGETNRGIAQRLRISEHTVEHHLSAIFERLDVRSRAQLASLVSRSGATV